MLDDVTSLFSGLNCHKNVYLGVIQQRILRGSCTDRKAVINS